MLVNSTLHIGGAEKVLGLLATNLDSRRYRVSATYLKSNGAVGEQLRRAGGDLLAIPGLRTDGKTDYLTAWKLLQLVRRLDVHLIHTHDIHSFIDGAICRLLHPGLRFVHTFHWGNYPSVNPKERVIERLLWRVPDALICVGRRQEAAIQELYGIPAARTQVIWNGTDLETAEPSPELREILATASGPIICSISTLIPQKGLEDLILAAATLKREGRQFLLLMIGDGHLRQPLQRLCDDLLIADRVRFLGWISDASRRVLPFCDAFVQSSHWEAMSIVILEAMAAGKPIVATRVGENDRVLEDGVTGLLVPAHDSGALASALSRVIQDGDLRHRLGIAAQQRHGDQLTIGHMVSRHEELYASLLSSSPDQQA